MYARDLSKTWGVENKVKIHLAPRNKFEKKVHKVVDKYMLPIPVQPRNETVYCKILNSCPVSARHISVSPKNSGPVSFKYKRINFNKPPRPRSAKSDGRRIRRK